MVNSNLIKILELFEKNSVVFLTGGAGVGKSYLANEVIDSYEKSSKKVISLGSTGISAVNIGGFTIHSFFVFGISSNFEELKRHDKKSRSRLKELNTILKKVDLLVIDEISMVSANMFDMIRYRLQTSNYKGDILIVGDFFQLPPILKNTQNNNLFGQNQFAFESDAWDFYSPKLVELVTSKRATDREFTDILHKIRIGSQNIEIVKYLSKLRDNKVDNLATYLYGTNIKVEEKNREKLNKIKEDEIIFNAQIQKSQFISDSKLNSWIKTLPVLNQLSIKEGALILFTKNRWGSFFNGERGKILKIDDDEIVIQKSNKKVVNVRREEFSLTKLEVIGDDFKEIELATFTQFPIKLAYAITIHKSQGMSIENLVCNIDDIFTKSQFYVALSRATNPKKLKIEFNRVNFENYIARVIRVSPKVVDFYINANPLFLD